MWNAILEQMNMVKLPLPRNFPARSHRKFYLNGRKYRVGLEGVEALRLLREIYGETFHAADRNWLVRLRGKIRAMDELDARAVLSLVVLYTDNRTLRLLAIWLRGRLGGIAGTSTLVALRDDPHMATRKEVARALVRMGAWVEVAEIAELDIDPRVRFFASAKPARPYRERLAEFASHTDHVAVTATRQRLFVDPEVDIHPGRPGKSVWLIRTILERIHRLVTGQSSVQK